MSAIDLNLLRIFDALLEEQSVTRAGARLGLTQSAVSHALNRLRHHFDDPLFVRGPLSMTPTARAIEVGPGIHAALQQISAAIQPSQFEPAQTDRRFIIATGAYGCATIVPPLSAKLAQRAPRAELVVIQPGPDVIEQLDTRRADFALWVNDNPPERVAATPLITEGLVWVVRPGHPVLDSPITLAAIAALPLVAIPMKRQGEVVRGGIVPDATWDGLRPFRDALAAEGLKQRTGVTVPDIYSAMSIVARSDMATLAPRRLGQMSERFGALRLIEPPHATPDLRVSLMLLKERASEPALTWMHGLLLEVAAEV